MPIYEYLCGSCGKKNSFLVYPWENEVLSCRFCGSNELQRIISRFARLRSDDERIESTVEDAMRSVDINNPESVKKWMRKALKDFSGELGSDIDVDEAVESLSEELGMQKGEGSKEGGEYEGEDFGIDEGVKGVESGGGSE